ncbi:hypothetical protein C450_19276 [Halococcus salifodinae DSM 8989]|uniref:Uncharacterized protein n=1 Tax=Halococcus salifodinae DSM 8989 TaxID=1227456 RepID=M0MSL7_9EURY|nr:hypothetical protein C450_19276 [Halococcus salifodinae DSM 8989]
MVKEKYTDHADILPNSVYHTSRGSNTVFVMQDRLSAEQAVEQGATPLADSDTNFRLWLDGSRVGRANHSAVLLLRSETVSPLLALRELRTSKCKLLEPIHSKDIHPTVSMHDIEESEYGWKAKVDEEHKEIRLEGLVDRRRH